MPLIEIDGKDELARPSPLGQRPLDRRSEIGDRRIPSLRRAILRRCGQERLGSDVRSSCAVYVDAGYLLAAAATRVTGTSLRNGVAADYDSLISSLIRQSEALAGLPVLRVNWYDAATNAIPDREQEQIGLLAKVKLRLGRFGFDGQQKGVDLRIGLDMVAHARNGAVDTIVLVSGDDDLTEAVEDAQMHGVEVILLAVPNREGQPHGVSRYLQRAADNLEVLDVGTLEAAVQRADSNETSQGASVNADPATRRIPTPAEIAKIAHPPVLQDFAYRGTTGTASTIAPEFAFTNEEISQVVSTVAEKVVASFLGSAASDQRVELDQGRPSIPRDLDRALLVDLSEALDTYNLNDGVRTQLRRRFWDIVDEHAD